MKRLVCGVLVGTVLATHPFLAAAPRRASMMPAADPQTFVGVVVDDSCAGVGHVRMRMGPTDAECARACVSEHGVPFVLDDGTQTYTLSDQKRAGELAARRVKVVGTLDSTGKKIQVQSIEAAG
jgi:hypothetical protein